MATTSDAPLWSFQELGRNAASVRKEIESGLGEAEALIEDLERTTQRASGDITPTDAWAFRWLTRCMREDADLLLQAARRIDSAVDAAWLERDQPDPYSSDAWNNREGVESD